ncbi:GT2 family glycosyltransferase [Chitinophaga niastensis]|uniref:GT2 family glycosyltransferase n=1 Tax=Chitinophaga niastensis TaxID=536980 RepID=A0A2P8HET0_CHINA|nr:galactosyltransferase-related protein [Chitinophaga niastensis]PSL44701.1 GT2 family glycosyltransferase [Chitinophaga niastensis]
MLFISAQPDDYYFLWQIQLQLFNLHQLGISPGNIHVLIAYDPQVGLRHYFADFIRSSGKAVFYVYPDNRLHRNYPSSIRPHILKQHFKCFPELKESPVFYMDADVLFRSIPDFEKLLKDDCWYVSDTRSYLNTAYIKQTGGEQLFLQMCETVNIPAEIVQANDGDTGGAQYLMKNLSYSFWNKVEDDCEQLYILMNTHNNREAEKTYLQSGAMRSEYKGIQSWCADMWAVLWNAWLIKQKVKISEELDFCWPENHISKWHRHKLLHYSGVSRNANSGAFCKGDYVHSNPFHASLDDINQHTCSFAIAGLIKEYRMEIEAARIPMRDMTFLIPVRIDSPDRLQNLLLIISYLTKYFDTNIIIGESDRIPHVPVNKLPPSCTYHFLPDVSPLFNHTHINNFLVKRAKTPLIAIYDTDAIVPVNQITTAINLLRANKADAVSPYYGQFVAIDKLFKGMFKKILDPQLFVLNIDKFTTATYRSWGGAIFIKKGVFLAAGMDNEYFKSWGPEDIERVKRMKNLGYHVRRVEGALFHLPHERLTNSGYSNNKVHLDYMREYISICNMEKAQLESYIDKWSWIKTGEL